MPRASATSGATEESISGRYRTTTATMHTTAIKAGGGESRWWRHRAPRRRAGSKTSGAYSLVRDRNRSPSASIRTMVRAVATSLRARRPSPAIMPGPGEGEHAESDDGVGTDQDWPRRLRRRPRWAASERRRRTPADSEEPDDTGHDGHDGGRLPGIDHEVGEHQPSDGIGDAVGWSADGRSSRGSVETGDDRQAKYRTKITATMQKLTGHPCPCRSSRCCRRRAGPSQQASTPDARRRRRWPSPVRVVSPKGDGRRSDQQGGGEDGTDRDRRE